jgi:hypothetical protein
MITQIYAENVLHKIVCSVQLYGWSIGITRCFVDLSLVVMMKQAPMELGE